jgi:hypothetical protein
MKQGLLKDGCSPDDYLNFAVSSSHSRRQIVRVRKAIEYPNLELMVRGEGVHALLPGFEGSMEEAVAFYRSIGTRGGKTFGELEAEGVPALAIRIEPLEDLPAADEGVPALAICIEPLEDFPAADEVSAVRARVLQSHPVTTPPISLQVSNENDEEDEEDEDEDEEDEEEEEDEVSPRARPPIPSRHITSHPSHHVPSHPIPSRPVPSHPTPSHPMYRQ